MKRLFVDTSAWAAIADKDDANHELALFLCHIVRVVVSSENQQLTNKLK